MVKIKGMSYNVMRKNIQEYIMFTLKKAGKEFKDIKVRKLVAEIKYDYGVGNLTVERIMENLYELDMIELKGEILQLKIK